MTLTKVTLAKGLPIVHAARLVAMPSEKITAANPRKGRSPEDNPSHTEIHFIAAVLRKRLPLVRLTQKPDSAAFWHTYIYFAISAISAISL